jgi:hypothetical protein
VLALVGIILLLDNFLLLGDFDPTRLWPLLLVFAGAQLLLRGDLLAGNQSRTFGITRGSVEAATLEVSAGEIDVSARNLQREGRLIAGQYAAGSRPAMGIDDTRAYIRMNRAATPWFSFADWEVGLATDLPWQIFVSTHLGQVNLDLSSLFIERVMLGTGFGDIRLVCPHEAFGPITVQSTLGNIQIVTPPGYCTRITVSGGPFFGVQVDHNRYEEVEPGLYHALDTDPTAPPVDVHIRGAFGDAYLA